MKPLVATMARAAFVTRPARVLATVGVLVSVALLAGCAPAHPAPSASPTPVTTAAGPERIAFTRWATPGTGEPSLWTGNADGSDLQPVGDQLGSFPDWSPDRTHLLFDVPDSDGDRQVATIRPDGGGLTMLTDTPGINEAADYSPDGATIAFDHADVGEFDPGFSTSLLLMNADGSNVRPLLDPAQGGYDYEPEYSPDGSSIAFVRYDPVAETAAVYLVDADGTDPRQLTPYDTYVEHPRWSPDGGSIIYNIEYETDLDDPRNGIWTVPTGGGEPLLLLPGDETLHPFKPDYSLEGDRILFGCFFRAEAAEDLCVMNADGTGVERLTRTTTFENHPVWD